jgi:hypothetical protein
MSLSPWAAPLRRLGHRVPAIRRAFIGQTASTTTETMFAMMSISLMIITIIIMIIMITATTTTLQQPTAHARLRILIIFRAKDAEVGSIRAKLRTALRVRVTAPQRRMVHIMHFSGTKATQTPHGMRATVGACKMCTTQAMLQALCCAGLTQI